MIFIGWAIVWKTPHGNCRWSTPLDKTIRQYRADAIEAFNKRCQFYFLSDEVIAQKKQYKTMLKHNLAKAVKVFAEAK